ncbi:MAG: hypothetical protein ACJAS1_005035 [Oleiphilaceae bacterium]|jgi:hypothetical protein
MNDIELICYMQELSMHGLGAETEFHNMIAALENPDTRQTKFVWFHLSSFLSHAAMASKYLDPIGKSPLKIKRKKILREILKIDEQSNVLPRNARDNIEHFDERLDNWLGKDRAILETVLDNRRAYNYLKVNEKRVKRVLLQDELIFVSENRDQTKFELELGPLFEEIKRIGDVADEWIVKNYL